MDVKDAKQELILQGIITPNNTLSKRYKQRLQANEDLKQLIYQATSFLQYDASLYTRLHCIIQELSHQPTCRVCNAPVKMRESGRHMFTFPETCGTKCFSSLPEVKEKRKNTNIKKYGADNFLLSQQWKENRKKVFLEKYGVDNVARVDDFSKKKIDTIIEK